MLDVLEVILFYTIVFGAFYGVGGFISDFLDRVGVWPMAKETPETCRSQTPLEASSAAR